ncbi:MAG: hypothetical protein K0S00_4443 [Xanthobacteraceae bacterium]|jgi:hypothetical protein|nr:hypothetical protein [Xanthobacteraceae bacterium]
MSADGIAARFRLKIRCFNCKVDTMHRLDMPAVEGAPTCLDELLESQFLAEQKFACKACEMPIGIIVGAADVTEPSYA